MWPESAMRNLSGLPFTLGHGLGLACARRYCVAQYWALEQKSDREASSRDVCRLENTLRVILRGLGIGMPSPQRHHKSKNKSPMLLLKRSALTEGLFL